MRLKTKQRDSSNLPTLNSSLGLKVLFLLMVTLVLALIGSISLPGNLLGAAIGLGVEKNLDNQLNIIPPTDNITIDLPSNDTTTEGRLAKNESQQKELPIEEQLNESQLAINETGTKENLSIESPMNNETLMKNLLVSMQSLIQDINNNPNYVLINSTLINRTNHHMLLPGKDTLRGLFKYSKTAQWVLKTEPSISCEWKNPADGYKFCTVEIEMVKISPGNSINRPNFTFLHENSNFLNESVEISYNYNFSAKDVPVPDSNGLLYSEIHRKYQRYQPLASSINTDQPLSIKYTYQLPLWQEDRVELDLNSLQPGLAIDPLVSSCSTLSSAGKYNLTQDLNSSGTCITINADNVELNCLGFSITFDTSNSNSGFGITSSDDNDITIRNCKILSNSTNHDRPISLNSASGLLVINNSITHHDAFTAAIVLNTESNVTIANNSINVTSSGGIGIQLFGQSIANTMMNTIANNIIKANGTGTPIGIAIFNDNNHYNTIEENNITSNGYGIQVINNASHNTFRKNYIGTSDDYGIVIDSVGNNSFIDNIINSSKSAMNITNVTGSLFEGNIFRQRTASGIRMQHITDSMFRNNIFSGTMPIHDQNETSGTNYIQYNNSFTFINWTSTTALLNSSINTTANNGFGNESNLVMANNTLAINATSLVPGSNLNSSAQIQLYGLYVYNISQIMYLGNFTTNETFIRLYGQDCSVLGICTWISYDNVTGIFTFNTTQMGSFAGNGTEFLPDIINPQVTWVTLGQRNYSSTSYNVSFNASIQEFNPDTVRFSFDNFTGTNFNATAANYSGIWQVLYNVSSLAEGPHVVTVFVNDTRNNANTTENITFIVDYTPPQASIDLPASGTSFGSGDIKFNTTVIDTNLTIISAIFVFDNASGTDFNLSGNRNGNNWSLSLPADTFIDGVHTLTIHANDTVGNLNATESITFTVSTASSKAAESTVSAGSGAGGGGGGGTFTKKNIINQLASYTWVQLAANSTASFMIDDPELALTKIEFTVKQEVYGAKIMVERYEEIPFINGFPGQVYRNLEITNLNLDGYLSGDYKIGFDVPVAWLEENNLSKEQIKLYFYSGFQWDEQPTLFGETDGKVAHFNAKTVNFGYFVIGAGKIAGEMPSNVERAIDETTPAEQNKPVEKTVSPVTQKPSSLNQVLILLAIIIVTIISAIIISIIKHHHRKITRENKKAKRKAVKTSIKYQPEKAAGSKTYQRTIKIEPKLRTKHKVTKHSKLQSIRLRSK